MLPKKMPFSLILFSCLVMFSVEGSPVPMAARELALNQARNYSRINIAKKHRFRYGIKHEYVSELDITL